MLFFRPEIMFRERGELPLYVEKELTEKLCVPLSAMQMKLIGVLLQER